MGRGLCRLAAGSGDVAGSAVVPGVGGGSSESDECELTEEAVCRISGVDCDLDGDAPDSVQMRVQFGATCSGIVSRRSTECMSIA